MGIVDLIAAALVAASPVSEPDWTRKPTQDEFQAAYPPLALMVGATGRVLLSCSVSAKGTIRSCEVLSESPAGLGFGPAALLMSQSFQVKPLRVSGLAVDGGMIRIPLSFQLPAQAARAETKPEPAAPSMAMARRILSVMGAEKRMQADVDLAVSTVEAEAYVGVDPTLKAKVIRAYRETLTEIAPDLLDASAATYAGNFTESQLADILAFYSSPTGQAYLEQQPKLVAQSTEAANALYDAVTDRLHAKFCRTVACAPSERAKP